MRSAAVARDTAEFTAKATARATKLAREAFVHQAAPGGYADEAFLADGGNFREFVRAEVRGMVSEKAGAYLRKPSVASRWLAELRSTACFVEGKLGVRAADAEVGDYGRFADAADYERWRASALCFLGYVNRRISEAEGVVPRIVEAARAASTGYDEDLLTRVRGYLVTEGSMPEEVRAPTRERLIRAVSEELCRAPTAEDC